MQDKAPPAFHGAAIVDDAVRCLARIDCRFLEDVVKGNAVAHVTYPDAERSVFIVHAHGDDGVIV